MSVVGIEFPDFDDQGRPIKSITDTGLSYPTYPRYEGGVIFTVSAILAILFIIIGFTGGLVWYDENDVIPEYKASIAFDDVELIRQYIDLSWDGSDHLPPDAFVQIEEQFIHDPSFAGVFEAEIPLRSTSGSPVSVVIDPSGKFYTISISKIDRKTCRAILSDQDDPYLSNISVNGSHAFLNGDFLNESHPLVQTSCKPFDNNMSWRMDWVN